MSTLVVTGSTLGSALTQLLMCEEIVPGQAPSYQLCKTIAAYHPLGAKMSDTPISMAQSQEREITITNGPEDKLKEAFLDEWKAIGADRHIFNIARTARIYGISSIALLSEGVPTDRPIAYDKLWNSDIGFNVLDPLNTAGSLVLNQDPNSLDFQKVSGVQVGGQPYHRSRTVTLLNEEPLYIEYTTSAFGFVGRSVYQRALYPLKSFIQTLITDDLVTLKSGVIIAKMKGPGSIIDQTMAAVAGVKREMIKEAVVGSIMNIDIEEAIESLDLENIANAYTGARKNILENIAVGADMPAKLLNAESFAEGFGEGSEDAKHVAEYVARIRIWMDPVYEWMTKIVQHRAWNPDFYSSIQKAHPEEYSNKPYRAAFLQWANSFRASWPNLLQEPDSEKVKVDDVKLKAIIALVEVLAPMMDPENKAAVIQWACDNFNELDLMFSSRLNLDFEALAAYTPPAAAEGGEGGGPQEPTPPKPFSAQDALTAAVARLPERRRRA